MQRAKIKDQNYFIRLICAIISLSTTFSIAITIVIKHLQSEIPLHICSPFIDPSNSVILIKIITWNNVLFQFSAMIFIISVYIQLFQTLKKSQEDLHQEMLSKRSNLSLLIQLFIITGSNILCWIPVGCIYLTSMFLDKYPIDMVIWTTIIVTPINSIINPIEFILTRKEKWEQITSIEHFIYQ